MKKVILSVLLLSIIMGLQAQELKVINLNKPDKSRNVTLMQALDKRHSERAFANKQLTHQRNKPSVRRQTYRTIGK